MTSALTSPPPMPTTAEKAAALAALHVPGDPLIVVNVWDAMTARIVARTPGVRALATASHSVAFSLGVDDGEGMSVDIALAAAGRITASTDLPVSVDFERGYAADAAGVQANVAKLIDAGATSVFMLGLRTEQMVANAVAAVRAPIAVFAHAGYLPLSRLAELGVGRISFGPQILGLTLSHLADAAAQLTARGEYPAELSYRYEL